MEKQPPFVPGGSQALGLAWTIPVLMFVYIGLGFWLGRLAGYALVGTLIGWGVGMWAVFYEIRKVLRKESDSPPSPPSSEGDA